MILRNSIRTPDGTELVSRHRHDHVEYTDANGKTYAVDGGTDYLRRQGHGDEVDTSIVVDNPTDPLVREHLMWGTYGVDGSEPLKWVLLKEMDTDHIRAVLLTQPLGEFHREAMEHELKLRNV